MTLMAIPIVLLRHPITRTHIIALVDGHRQMVEARLLPVYHLLPKHRRGLVVAVVLRDVTILTATIHTAQEEVVLLQAAVAVVEILTITTDIPVVVQTTMGNTVAMDHLPLIMVEITPTTHITTAEDNRCSRLQQGQELQVQDEPLRHTLRLRIITHEVLATPTHMDTLEEVHPPAEKAIIPQITKMTFQ
jgi:hypothetical protein